MNDDEEKYCADCRNCVVADGLRCRLFRDIVTGRYLDCRAARSKNGQCREYAEYWQPRDGEEDRKKMIGLLRKCENLLDLVSAMPPDAGMVQDAYDLSCEINGVLRNVGGGAE